MKKFFKQIVTYCMVVFTAMTSFGTPVLATEMDVQKAFLKVSVQGDGKVTLKQNDFVKEIDNQSIFQSEFLLDSTIEFTFTDGQDVLESVKINQQSVDVVDHMYSFSLVKDSDVQVAFASSKVEETNKDVSKESATVESESIQSSSKQSLKRMDEKYKEQMIEDYHNGKYNESNYKEVRKAIATDAGLLKYCDDDYFLKDHYYEVYPISSLMNGDLTVLSRLHVNNVNRITFGSKPQEDTPQTFSNELKVKHVEMLMQDVYWKNQYRGRLDNGTFTLSNGKVTFCSDGMAASPQVGDTTSAPKLITDNVKLRKALYYGYNGPEDKLTNSVGGANAAKVVTDDLVSYANTGKCIGTEWGQPDYEKGYHWKHWEKEVWDMIMALPDPGEDYDVYQVQAYGEGYNWQWEWTHKQTLVWGVWNPKPKKGKLQIKKDSANPSITNNNGCYSLEGAEYGVFANSNATNLVTTLKTNKDGWSNVSVDLDAKTYYVKETKAPKGYALNPNVVPVTVNAGKTTTINNGSFKDVPQSDPVNVLLKKVDAATGKAVPTGKGTLAGAEYTFKYYSEQMSTDPAKSGKTPKRTWVMKTDKDGFVTLNKDYKVSGDDFYYNGTSYPTLPIGTVTIQETKAPEGYHLNNEVLIRQITSKGSGNTVNTYNYPTSKENVVELTLKKYQSNSQVMISGAEFEHVMPDGSKETVKTNAQGVVTMKGLHKGKHTLKEVKVKDGYVIRPETIELDVASDGTVTMTSASKTGISFTNDSLKNGTLVINDDVNNYSLQIIKVNQNGKLLDGAEFTLYEDKECTKALETKQTVNGKLVFNYNVKDRTHYFLKETKAPKGYRIPMDIDKNGNAFVHVYDVYTESTPEKGVFNFVIDGIAYNVNNTTGDIHLEGDAANRVVSIQVVNHTGKVLPETGGSGNLAFLWFGLLCVTLLTAIAKNKKF